MRSFILAACILAVAFAAPHFRRKGPSQDDLQRAGKGLVLGLNAVCEGFGNLVEAYQQLDDSEDKRSWEAVLEGLKEVCDDLGDAKMEALDANGNGELEQQELDDASAVLMSSLADLCKAMEELSKLYNGDKRSWDDVFMGLGGVCLDLQTAIMAEMGEKRQKGDQPKPSKEEVEALIAECEALKNGDKRDDDPSLEEVCMELAKMLKKGPKPTEASKRGDQPKPSKEEVEALIAECEALKNGDKRDDDPSLEEVCMELAKMLKKGPKPTEASKRGDQPKPSKEEVEALIAECEALKNGDKRDDDPSLEEVCMELAKMLKKGPKPTEASKRGDQPKPSKEEVEALISECEALKNGDKRDDDPSLEEVCMELAKMLKKGPKPTEASKRGDQPKPSKEEVEALIAECEALKNGDKRDDDPSLEEVCMELAKMLKKGPKPTEASKRGKGPRPPKTDADGNTLPQPSKDDMPTKEEVEELIALCEALADDEKRDDDFDEDDLEDVCRELAKMLEKGPKPTEASKRGKGPRPPKTDADGNTLPPPSKDDMPTKEEVEELIALCETLADDEKRDDDLDEDDLEDVCRELAKMLKKGPKPTEASKRGKGPRPPKTDADGNTLPPPSKDDMPTKEEVEELIAVCETLADDEKREDDLDEDDLEDVCRELAKMLKKGPKPTEASKRGKGPRPPKTDADGNTLPPPSKDDMPTKEEVEELIALCEALADDEKRDDDLDEDDLENVCRELAKMLKKGPKPTEASKRGKGPRPPKTDADGNTLPPPSKDDMPTKEEVEELIALCEALDDDEKRDDDFDEDDLEDVCSELAKMLKKPERRRW